MPSTIVKIEWDWPDEPFWMNADNCAVALHQACPKTKFVVTDVKEHMEGRADRAAIRRGCRPDDDRLGGG